MPLSTRVVEMTPSSTESLLLATFFPQNVIADKEGAACGPTCSNVKVADILKAKIVDKFSGLSEISGRTVNEQQSSVKKRARISRYYELYKESLEKSYQMEVAIIRLHLTGSMQVDRLEKLKVEYSDKLKELELAHPTAKNPIQHDTEFVMEKVDGHSFEGDACHDDSFDAIDICCQSKEPNGRRYVHEVENRRLEVSQTKAAPEALESKSSRQVASLHSEENKKTANLRSTSTSVERASAAEVELDGGGASTRNNREDVLTANTSLEEIDLGKEITGGAEKDTMNGLSPPVSSGEGAEEMTSRDVLTSRGSAVEVFFDSARADSNDKENPPSKAAPHGTSASPSVKVPQSSDFRKASVDDCGVSGFHSMTIHSTKDRNGDGSEFLLSPEPVRSALGNISPSHCLEGMVSENPKSDARDDIQIRDVHRKVTSASEFPSSSVPGSSPDLPPVYTNKDGSGQEQELQNSLQEAEPEGPNSLNCVSSDCGVAQMQRLVRPQISEDSFPPTGLHNIQLAGEIEIQFHHDTLISLQVETGTHRASDSHMAATQTISQTMACTPTGSLDTGGRHVCSSLLPSIIPPLPSVQGAAERPSPDPLENELEKIKREMDHNDQRYADLNVRLKSERGWEIQETVAQINAKYDLKLKEAEVAYKRKKNDLDSYKDRVYMHIKLVEALKINASGLQL